MLYRTKNFITHTATVFYITVVKGHTVDFEMPGDTGGLKINHYNG